MMVKKPLLLDTYCKAGGAGMGYSLAGFDVVGVDIEPQPHYPFKFYRADAIEFIQRYGKDFNVIHASPVCKGYSRLASINPDIVYPDQIPELRDVLNSVGIPYVIENVVGAPLKNYVMLCGSMFGLRVYRHRLFECNPPIYFPPMACNHWGSTQPAGNKSNRTRAASFDQYTHLTITGHDFNVADARLAMGISWMNGKELSQAIPPAYTQWLGGQIIKHIETGLRPHDVFRISS